mmetsp:Transcript_23051/g.55572  ORF Transcript_23051/g.55572 Transcript_23051/m.55572 type:complete len:331 (-) Transcript_23051:525-1517(-)
MFGIGSPQTMRQREIVGVAESGAHACRPKVFGLAAHAQYLHVALLPIVFAIHGLVALECFGSWRLDVDVVFDGAVHHVFDAVDVVGVLDADEAAVGFGDPAHVVVPIVWGGRFGFELCCHIVAKCLVGGRQHQSMHLGLNANRYGEVRLGLIVAARPLFQCSAVHGNDIFGMVGDGGVAGHSPRFVQDSQSDIIVLVNDHPILRIRQHRHRNMRLPTPHDSARTPVQQQSATVLPPIPLVRDEEPFRVIVHPQRHILPLRRIHRILPPQPPRVRVFARCIQGLVQQPHGAEIEEAGRGGIMVGRFDVQALFEYRPRDVTTFLVYHYLDYL